MPDTGSLGASIPLLPDSNAAVLYLSHPPAQDAGTTVHMFPGTGGSSSTRRAARISLSRYPRATDRPHEASRRTAADSRTAGYFATSADCLSLGEFARLNRISLNR
jgi:hypothetical protein